MIFWYSATGNSYWAAKRLSDVLGERLISVADAQKGDVLLTFSLSLEETLGFVFPVHAWGPPETLLTFIDRMELLGFDGQYVFALATCGDSAGATMGELERLLGKKGLPLNARWEISMPNNYLPMYDVDSPALEHSKLAQAETALSRIENLVLQRKPDAMLIGDRFGTVKSALITPLFRRFARRAAAFYATDACISCGRCVRVCPAGAIRMGAHGPEWKSHCDHCCACINRCPTRAIQYGKATVSRGRYVHPIWRSGTFK